MEVTLTRTGGIIPLKKKSSLNLNWTYEDLAELKAAAELTNNNPNLRDALTYHLTCNEKTFPIDLEKVPRKFKNILEQLKDNLQIQKF